MLFAKPKPDEALVRIGREGAKVAIRRRLFVNPLVHSLSRISLSTYDIEVICEGANSAWTADGFRVDINAVFYVRVDVSEEAVLKAARGFGTAAQYEVFGATLKPKFEFVLRNIAAELNMLELLHRRQEFADIIQESIGHELLEQNGICLENVGISRVEQTPLEAYNPDDIFDAEAIPHLCAMMEKQILEEAEAITSTNRMMEEILQKQEVNADAN